MFVDWLMFHITWPVQEMYEIAVYQLNLLLFTVNFIEEALSRVFVDGGICNKTLMVKRKIRKRHLFEHFVFCHILIFKIFFSAPWLKTQKLLDGTLAPDQTSN